MAISGCRKLCESSLTDAARLGICEKLLEPGFSGDAVAEFLSNLVQASPAQCTQTTQDLSTKVSHLTPALVAAWLVYKEAGRSCLKESFSHLTSLGAAYNNPSLRQAPFSLITEDYTKIAVASGKQREQTAQVDREVFDNLDQLGHAGYQMLAATAGAVPYLPHHFETAGGSARWLLTG